MLPQGPPQWHRTLQLKDTFGKAILLLLAWSPISSSLGDFVGPHPGALEVRVNGQRDDWRLGGWDSALTFQECFRPPISCPSPLCSFSF